MEKRYQIAAAEAKSSAVFIPHGPGAVNDVATQIRNGLLQATVDR